MNHVLIAGGSRGLGRVLAERFASQGARVSVISRSSPAPDSTAHEIMHFAADLEIPGNARQIAEQIIASHGPIRYLVCCQRYRGAGDPWQGELRVEVDATRELIETLQGHFMVGGDRAIGMVSSVYALYVGTSQPLGYHVAKAALNALVRYYAQTLGRRGIRVNAIMPLSYIKPESRAFYQGQEALHELYQKLVPLGRMGDAEDNANALEFLLSPKSSFINGQCLFVDGGVSVVWPESLARELSGI